MRACVFVVHEEPRFVDQVTAELGLAGYEIVAFTELVVAMHALGKADRVGEGRRFDLGAVMGGKSSHCSALNTFIKGISPPFRFMTPRAPRLASANPSLEGPVLSMPNHSVQPIVTGSSTGLTPRRRSNSGVGDWA